MFSEINWVATLVASVAMFAVGMFWYSPAGFGKQWMKEMGFTKRDMKKMQKEGMGPTMVMGFLSNVVVVLVLGMVLRFVRPADLLGGVYISLIVAVGFVLTATLGAVLWERKSWTLFNIHAGYTLVNYALAGAILTHWMLA